MKRDKHLPAGMYYHHGAFYLVRRNKWIALGKELAPALQEYARHLEIGKGGMRAAIARAVQDIRTRGSANTIKQYEVAAKKLESIFRDFTPAEVKPIHVRQMLDHMRATPNMANRCRSVLMLAMRLSVEAGEAESNPVSEVKPLTEAKRERYVTDEEFAALCDAAEPVVRIVMQLCYGTGQRIGDVLAIKRSDLLEAGIAFRQQKTKQRLVVEWTEGLREVVAAAKALRAVPGLWLICQRNGRPYSYRGMRDAFERARIAAKVEDVTLHDLRAKAATDAEAQGLNPTLLLGHTSRQRTERYIRQRMPKVVQGPRLGGKVKKVG